ncbi:P-loop containing nucleoside triphosphate hydrolase protein [Sistotremastrum suecicum HHB10207 ss-3]|uniref:p-loop containing nucleoside triphosphate hydrolase protein n=1 Tax=Sistotremastrum suecicum HHB10207 ss-3 TaxID=1314776 RepID=A0A166GG65_9AGAM|nr:P-loop containing nucleoside triphosphate hydrolase protein [Sistotremastrum suecicum HHB10207 ss-3]
MPSKRRNQDSSDVEESATPSKRARVSEDRDSEEPEFTQGTQSQRDEPIDIDEDEEEPSQSNKRSKGKKKPAREEEEEEEAEESNEEEDVDANEENFRKEHLESIRKSIAEKANQQGAPGKVAIIKKIELHNFMCHKRLTVNLGEQINFIIGHNGSGKSAILTALVLALGTKASMTGRGSGIKSFVMEGEKVAEVEVTIKNEGPEAYKPEVYGKSIVVSRRFTSEGSSNYKIQTEHKKTVSTKREELTAMCDHMQLQMDNPMNVLTQDSSRQFLSFTHPREKYQLFLRGTQLAQLMEEYEICAENIAKAKRLIEQKRAIIPELKENMNMYKGRVKEAEKMIARRDGVEALKAELAWAHIKGKEQELEKAIRDGSKLQEKIATLRNSLQEAEINSEKSAENLATIEALVAQGDDLTPLTARKQELGDLIKANKEEVLQATANEREINEAVRRCNDTIDSLTKKIEEALAKLREDRQGKEEAILAKIKDEEEKLAKITERIRDIPDEIRTQKDRKAEIDNVGNSMKSDMDRLRGEIVGCESQITQIRDTARNELAKFGENLGPVLAAIQSESWTGQAPLGPIGKYVKLRDEKWAPIFRIMLGSQMSGFVVENGQDRQKLLRIMQQYRCSNTSIVVAKFDLFDYSRGEPAPEYLTALRALDIENEWVKRVLINGSHIESIYLSDTRAQGEHLLSTIPRGGTGWSLDLFIVRNFGGGSGKSTNFMEKLRHEDKRHQLFIGGSITDNVNRWTERKADLERQLQEINLRGRGFRQTHDEITRTLKALDDENRRLSQEKTQRDRKISNFRNELHQDAPVDLTVLEESRNETKEEKQSLLDQFVPITARKQAANDANRPLVKEQDDIRKKIRDIEDKKHEVSEQLEKATMDHLKAKNAVTHWTGALQREEKKVTEHQEMQSVLETEFEEWTVAATENFALVENPRKAPLVKKELDSLKAALEKGDQERGYTLEEAEDDLIRAKEIYRKAGLEIKTMDELTKALSDALNDRMRKWAFFRDFRTLQTKEMFAYLLGHRGYFGVLKIDHIKCEMSLKVRTDDQANTQGKDKDPKALSGGEKSYSTICLLLAMWRSMSCPVRCLDEFDVFMDSVNRRISMKLMISEANIAEATQHILITPQDMSAIQLGSTVRVQRMNDPGRNQGILAAV